MKNTKKAGIGSGTLTESQIGSNTINIFDTVSGNGDIVIDIHSTEASTGDLSIDSVVKGIFDENSSIQKFTFPSDPLAIVCDLKNKQIGNVEIFQILEVFLLTGTLNIGDSELEKHFHNPSNAAKEKADNIRKHFESKFTLAALKSGDVSDTRKKMMQLLREDLTVNQLNSAWLPLLVTIPDFYDEDLNLEYLQSHYCSEKSDYENIEVPVVKTLYPVTKTSRGNGSRYTGGKSYPGASYFWVDDESHIYRIWCERTNNLRPFLEYFFSKESVDVAIHRISRDKIPSVDLFFYDIKKLYPAEITDI